MTKQEVKKLLPYNTIAKCEKAYRQEVQNAFNFEGINTEEVKIIKSCVFNIFSSIKNDSAAQLEKFFAGKENRMKSFYAWKTGHGKEKEKAIDLLW